MWEAMVQGTGTLWAHAAGWLLTHRVPYVQPLPCFYECFDPLTCLVRVAVFSFNSLIGHPC